MTIMNKYEVLVVDKNLPYYIQSNGVEIMANGTAIFYDNDADEKEIIYTFSPSHWKEIKLVE